MKSKKLLVICSILVLCLITIAAFFITKQKEMETQAKNNAELFYEGTTINDVDVSGLSVDEAKQKLIDMITTYSLTVKFRDEEAVLTAQDGITVNESIDVAKLKTIQNEKKQEETTVEDLAFVIEDLVSIDQDKIREKLMQLDAMNAEFMKLPENPSFEYDKDAGVLKLNEGKVGNTLDPEAVISVVIEAIQELKTELNVEACGLYKTSLLTVDSPEAIALLEKVNSKMKMEIVYTFPGNKEEKITKDMIASWMMIDENGDFQWIHDSIQQLINQWAEKYNQNTKNQSVSSVAGSAVSTTVATTRKLDTNALFDDILKCLDEGKSVKKAAPMIEESSSSSSASNMGDNYVDVDLTNQKLYLYKNGQMIMSTSIVTGNVSAGHATPTGVFTVKGMSRNVVLRGPDYASPVSYWMPFNGGIGFHDATWRGSFGGSIYKYNGSHGCINMPKGKAQFLYENISVGYKVIVHGGVSSVPGKKPETQKPETETKAPETQKPETETKAPETQKPETETKAPETQKPETETKAPETQKPETDTKAPETQKTETMSTVES